MKSTGRRKFRLERKSCTEGSQKVGKGRVDKVEGNCQVYDAGKNGDDAIGEHATADWSINKGVEILVIDEGKYFLAPIFSARRQYIVESPITPDRCEQAYHDEKSSCDGNYLNACGGEGLLRIGQKAQSNYCRRYRKIPPHRGDKEVGVLRDPVNLLV